MKIENIIDDIKRDLIELTDTFSAQFRKENPTLKFSVSLPGIEELATVKSIALIIEEENVIYLSVNIHTHNGNRVFENAPKEIKNNEPVPYHSRHPSQDRFVGLLRDIIRKRKLKMKAATKAGTVYNDLRNYANTQ